GDDLPGQCASNERACTRDYATYCGCDGQEFHGSGSCPGQRYAHRGECNQAGNKDDDGSGAGTKR
ncbi:MAG: hypothetical protein K0V04_36815, partial [Deltaproteobacteria bacterium]|nr:hypothetical protein [Deltaproteobacteria bacterium]